MRALPAAALATLALVAAGCGASRAATTGGGDLGADAAKLVPANALALVSVDTDQGSAQWARVDQLTSGLPLRTQVLDKVNAALARQGLDYNKDVKPALGPEVDVAVLKIENGKPEAIALARPDDQSKLSALVAKFDTGTEHYTVQRVGDWSVVADSAEAFAAVRAAQSGTSLADTSAYLDAQHALGGDAIARAFVAKRAIAQLPRLGALVGRSAPDWIAADVTAEGSALQLQIAHPRTATDSAGATGLLGHVPSGALLAVSFHGSGAIAAPLRALGGSSKTTLGVARGALAPILNGDGVVYLRAGGLVPIVGVELRPQDPQAAVTALRSLAAKLGSRAGGALTLIVRREGPRVFAADSELAITELRGSGPKLVNDAAFKDAVRAAGGGRPLAYADVAQLRPFVQALAPALGTQLPKPLLDSLGRVGTVVAVTRRTGTADQLVIRITRS